MSFDKINLTFPTFHESDLDYLFPTETEAPCLELDEQITLQMELVLKQKEVIERENEKMRSILAVMDGLVERKKAFLRMTPTEQMLRNEIHVLKAQLASKTVKPPVLEDVVEDVVEEEEEVENVVEVKEEDIEEKVEIDDFDWRSEMINIRSCMITEKGYLYKPSPLLIDTILKNISEQIEEIEKTEMIIDLLYVGYKYYIHNSDGNSCGSSTFTKIQLVTSNNLYDLVYHHQGKPLVNNITIRNNVNDHTISGFTFNGFDNGHSYIHLHSSFGHNKTELVYGEFYKFIPINSITLRHMNIIKKYIKKTKGSLGDHVTNNPYLMMAMIKDKFDVLKMLLDK